MIRRWFLLIFATAAVGCAGKNFKAEHPVVGPPPPRIRGANPEALVDNDRTADVRAQSELQLTGSTDRVEGDGPIPMTAVAARVNGQPILVGQVMAELRPK